MLIKILGSGCAGCAALERAVHTALDRLGREAVVADVTDYAAIAGYGVMNTPALVIDEQVVLTGRVPRTGELVDLLGAYARQPGGGGPAGPVHGDV